jgi:hypothetical protein
VSERNAHAGGGCQTPGTDRHKRDTWGPGPDLAPLTLSYEYSLSADPPAEDAVADLKELAVMNPKRPCNLVMHVRETSGIDRVSDILKQLEAEFEVGPLDVLMKMAGEHPTFKARYLVEWPQNFTSTTRFRAYTPTRFPETSR